MIYAGAANGASQNWKLFCPEEVLVTESGLIDAPFVASSGQ